MINSIHRKPECHQILQRGALSSGKGINVVKKVEAKMLEAMNV